MKDRYGCTASSYCNRPGFLVSYFEYPKSMVARCLGRSGVKRWKGVTSFLGPQYALVERDLVLTFAILV